MDPFEVRSMTEFFDQVVSWFADPGNWTGTRGLIPLTGAHLSLSVAAVVAAGILALPFAIYLGHVHRGGALAVSVVNVGRAIPTFGVIGVMFPLTLAFAPTQSPLGYWATLIALVLLAMPPMFINSYAGIRGVDPAQVEAARGMGMTDGEVLRRVELPMALPLVMAGVRSAAVAVVATATLSAWVGYNTLGTYVFVGFAQRDDVLVFVGGLVVAVLALVAEVGFGVVERWTDPMRRVRRVKTPSSEFRGTRPG
jgi:osmoprotectant transport system permease protein